MNGLLEIAEAVKENSHFKGSWSNSVDYQDTCYGEFYLMIKEFD